MMAGIIEKGIPDPAVLFLAIGDLKSDHYPLQVGQFESGDLELDTWLTRTYLEGNGGGNGGESYALAWYFASQHTVTDAWEKRKTKGFLFTVGDEPCHKELAKNTLGQLMGTTPEAAYTHTELLKAAQEKWDVYHLQIMEGSQGGSSLAGWKELLGDKCIQISNHNDVAKTIADIVFKNTSQHTVSSTTPKPTASTAAPEEVL
jgi:hypothetical protein